MINNNNVAKEFIKRILPNNTDDFILKFEDTGEEYYKLYCDNGKITVEGNSMSSIACGVYYYLKEYCRVNLSWCGNRQIDKIDIVTFNGEVINIIEQNYRAFLNYCTYGYSMSWWDWSRWESELDFLALNGINLIVQVVGIEAVWYYSLLELGVDKEDALAYISAPTHWPWQMMTNIEGYLPAMSEKYIEERYILGKKINDRMVELGMAPIQAGFSGCIPICVVDKFPNAECYKKSKWCGFAPTYELNPLDPLFGKFADIFYRKQQELFGIHHYYACDPFHENEPPIQGSDYLKKVSMAISSEMNKIDDKYIWCMQSWSIRKDIACAVDKEHLLVLDLAGAKHKLTDNFWGYDFISGNLHNFGGRINMHGDIRLLAKNQFKQIKSICNNIVGTGLFMEGIEQNPLYYDIAFHMLTSAVELNIDDYLIKYANRRYGSTDDRLIDALILLKDSVYKSRTNGVELSSMVAARPAICVKKSGPNAGFKIPYDQQKLIKARDLLAECKSLKLKDGYGFDLYDISRQILSNELQSLQKKWSMAYAFGRRAKYEDAKCKFIDKLNEINVLLLTRDEYNFNLKLQAMKSLGQDDDSKRYYSKCLKTLLTVWGGDDIKIFDYSWREWGGLVGEFYIPRWQIFFNYIDNQFKLPYILRYGVLRESVLPRVHGRESFRANDIYSKIADFELDWCNN